MNALSGVWANGAAGPWLEGKAYRDGAAVTFPEKTDTTDPITVTVEGEVAPSAFSLPAGDFYTFVEGAQGGRIDFAAVAAEGNRYPIGSGLTMDVPIATAAATTGPNAPYSTLRLFGQMSDGGRTASLFGSGNIGGSGSGTHGVWLTEGDITWAPHTGETQILTAGGTWLQGGGTITVTGQTDDEGNVVGGGTVRFAGHLNGTNWNGSFNGSFVIKDGATIDFAMTRTYGENADEQALFRNNANSNFVEGGMSFTLTNGATLRFSGCRGVLGGWSNAGQTNLVQNQPIHIGRDSSVEYNYKDTSQGQQYTPYGFYMNGDGATIRILDGDDSASGKPATQRGLFQGVGTTLTVAGVGQAGDPSDPKTDQSMVTNPEDPEGDLIQSETYGLLTEGITAVIEGEEGTSFRRWQRSDQGYAEPTLNVGTNSTLRILCDAQTGDGAFIKTGAGRLTLEHDEYPSELNIEVREGALGGVGELTFDATTVTVRAGAAIEAGLTLPLLTLDTGAILAIDATGATQLRADRVLFESGGVYPVRALGTVPAATGREPVKVLAWSGVQGVGSVSFMLDDALASAGYGIEVRDDGLYLMSTVTYVRELTFTVDPDNPMDVYRVAWYSTGAWYLEGDPDKTPCDWAASATVGANALFILPDAYADGTVLPPRFVLVLDKPVTFASVRFAVWVSDPETGARTLETRSAAVTYHYDLTGETMPGDDQALSFTWVPSLTVTAPEGLPSGAATISADVPAGYAYELRDNAVIVYAAATKPALNVSFTGKGEGDPSWIGADADPCGAVAFAGVYWNNAVAGVGGDTQYLGQSGNYGLYRIDATVAGVGTDAEGNVITAPVTFVSVGATNVASRRGEGQACLAAGYLTGSNTDLPAELLASGNLDDAGTSSGWSLKVDEVPFARYDLYLLFAGNTDDSVTYPAVRVKVDSGDWRTYTLVNGWAAPAATGDEWRGQGGVREGGFVDGVNVLHLRLSGAEGGTLQVAPCDGGNADPANVGLAGFQIVACEDDGAYIRRLGAGAWSDPSGWEIVSDAGTDTREWLDSTAAAPRYALIPATTRLEADLAAAFPYLRLTGSATMTFEGLAGSLSTATLDLYEATAGATFNFEEDLFATPPNVILAPDITLTLPESDTGTVRNAWRWIYDDGTRAGGASSESATLRKTQGGDLVVEHEFRGPLEIQEGTLWLSVEHGEYDRQGIPITGDGIFGKTGVNGSGYQNLWVGWNDLRTTGASGGIIARCDAGFLYLVANGGKHSQVLPAGMTIQAEGAGTVIFQNSGTQRQFFQNGVMQAVNGGTVRYRSVTNIFDPDGDYANLLPDARLDSGMFYIENATDSHFHMGEILSGGNSAIYYANNNNQAWSREAVNLWGGKLTVESGHLAAYADQGQNNSLAIRARHDHGFGTGSYIQVAEGAIFFCDLPIQGGQNNANRSIIKTGGGIWVQTRSTANGAGNNGSSWWASDLQIREGTLRFNLGSVEQSQQGGTRAINVYSGARLDGAGRINSNINVTIYGGATLSSGIPADAVWADTAHPWYGGLPAAFKGEQSNTISRIYVEGNLSLQANSILEFDLNDGNLLHVDGTTTFGSAVTVRLKNLPTALPTARRLTDFAGTVSGSPTISCPEAAALDAAVLLCTTAEATGSGDDSQYNLWLVPSEANYTWTDRDGKWSEALWRQGDTEGQTFPYADVAASTNAPTGRIQASTRDFALAVDRGTRVNDGRLWGAYALVFAAEEGRTATLTQGAVVTNVVDELSGQTTPTYDGGLNMPNIGVSLWKLGAGRTVLETPLALGAAGGAATGTIAAGEILFRRGIVVATPISGTARNTAPIDLEIYEGATVGFDLTATEAEVNWLAGAGDTQGWSPLRQTLSGDITGAGTLALSGASAVAAVDGEGESLFGVDRPQLTLTGTADSGVSYRVSDATLTLAGAIPSASFDVATRRTAEVGLGGRIELKTATAIGWATNWVWRLTADTAEGTRAAVVATEQNARVRGLVQVLRSGDDPAAEQTATFGTSQAHLDGLTRFDVPAATTLQLLGFWQTPQGVSLAGVEKTGAGVLEIAGEFGANVPVALREGTLRVAGSVNVTDLNDGSTVPDWEIFPGATLAFASATSGAQDFGNGTLTLRGGATIDVGGNTVTLRGKSVIEDGAVIAIGAGNLMGALTFNSNTEVTGSVTVSLDGMSLDALENAGAKSYPLISFAEGARHGGGVFLLGGDSLVALSQRGWTLHDNGNVVTLEAFGNGDFYTWAGTDADTGVGNWGNVAWVANGSDARVEWPSDGTPAVVLQDRDPLDEAEEIPTAARTLDWTLGAQTIGAFRCDNSQPADGDTELSHDYTLLSSGGTANTLSIRGDFLKTGDAKLTVSRILSFGADGALRILGGETELAALVRSESGNGLAAPVTLAGDATLRLTGSPNRNFSGRIEGDGTGTIIQAGSGSLTLGSELDSLGALQALSGTVYLAADGQYAVAPAITLAADATLGYTGTLAQAGDVVLDVNPGQTAAGTLLWQAAASAETARAPRLASADGAALRVSRLRYDAAQGHLVIDPGVLPATATLALEQGGSETEALWLGAHTDLANGFALAGLSADAAHGGILAAEPVVDPFADPVWSTNRVVTLTLDAAKPEAERTFAGTFMGALTAEGTEVRAGLTLLSATPDAAAKPRLTLSGQSTDAHLGALTVGPQSRAEVTGVWAGPVAVDAQGGELGGSGTVGSATGEVRVPAGATVTASVLGRREQADGTYREEVIPSTLTVGGTLRVENGTKLRVLVRKTLQGASWVSCVETQMLNLPMVGAADGGETLLDVTVEIEPGASASNVKILGWQGLAGGGKVNGTVTVVDPQGNPVEGSFTLRQKSDGLYLYRSNSRFWMILR